VWAVAIAAGCEEEQLELDAGEQPSLPHEDAGEPSWPDDEEDAGRERDAGADVDAAAKSDAGSVEDRQDASQGALVDAGTVDARPDATQESPAPIESPRTEVPDPLVGAWDDGALDFVMWENYRQGYWAGRNAAPTREAMIFSKNGDATFYRYQFGLNQYEELIDCEGTVTFADGTFTFYPTHGRKRFIDASYAENSVDRPLTAAELIAPKLAGTRAFEYDPANPSKLRIIVPSSAPYNWYRKQ
jgi:hypothetical protein